MDCSRMWHMRKPNKVRLKYWPITDFVWASSHFANTNKYLMCACVVTWQKTHRQSPTHSNVTSCCTSNWSFGIFTDFTAADDETKKTSRDKSRESTRSQPREHNLYWHATEWRHTWVSKTEASLKLESRPQDTSGCREAVHHGTVSSSAGVQSTKDGTRKALLSPLHDDDNLPSLVTLTSRWVWFWVLRTSSWATCSVQQLSLRFSGCPLSSDDDEVMNSVKNRRVHSYPCCNQHTPSNNNKISSHWITGYRSNPIKREC